MAGVVVATTSGYYVRAEDKLYSFFTCIKPLGKDKGFQLVARDGQVVGTADTLQDAVDRACLLHRLGVVSETKV